MIARRRMLAVLAAGIAAPAAVAGCANKKDAPEAGAASSSASAPATGGSASSGAPVLDKVKVTSAFGSEPKVSFPTPLDVTAPESAIVSKGTGATIAKGDWIGIHSAYFGAKDGKLLQSAWTTDGYPGHFVTVDPEAIGPDSATFFASATVGSRYKMAGVAQQGEQQIPVIEVSDIVSKALTRATGAKKPLPAGQPAFSLEKNGAPKLEGRPSIKAPATTTATVTIEGTGPETAPGQALLMQYTGWKLDGSTFDSSWKNGSPFQFVLGSGQVIKGWDEGLAGKKVGSQVLLVIPPAEAYGAKGDSDHQLAGETLIFVADILDAIAPAKAPR